MKSEIENVWKTYGEMLLALLPAGRQEEILSNPDPEGLRPYLYGTTLSELLNPANERFFESVIAVARNITKNEGGFA